MDTKTTAPVFSAEPSLGNVEPQQKQQEQKPPGYPFAMFAADKDPAVNGTDHKAPSKGKGKDETRGEQEKPDEQSYHVITTTDKVSFFTYFNLRLFLFLAADLLQFADKLYGAG